MATINIVGAGHMGGAIARALCASGMHAVTLVDTDSSKLNRFSGQCARLESSLRTLGEKDAVILAIAPQDFSRFAQAATCLRRHEGLVLSVMAGLSVSGISRALQCTQIVRSIPNTPSELGWGMTAFYPAPGLAECNLELARLTLGAIGEVVQVERESLLDPATALCGGGPAFVAFFLDGLLDYGISAGFDRDSALKMALQVLRGTGELISQSAKPPMQICREVMTPQGTTERGIRRLEDLGLKALLSNALKASADRCSELNSIQA